MKKEIKSEQVKEEENVEAVSENEAALYKQMFEEVDNKYKRVFAEFENYKKRTEKENGRIYENSKMSVLTGLLPIIDSFEQAKEADSTDQLYKSGIELIFQQLQDYLKSIGVTEINTKDAKFDPELHDAVSVVEDSGLDSGMIVSTFRKGYKLGTSVIRHSMVIVQK